MIRGKYSHSTWGYSPDCLYFKLKFEKDARNLDESLSAVAICTCLGTKPLCKYVKQK